MVKYWIVKIKTLSLESAVQIKKDIESGKGVKYQCDADFEEKEE